VTASQQSGSIVLPTNLTPPGGSPAIPRGLEHRARLAGLVSDVVNHLESPDGDRLRGSVDECNTALERFLEMQRDVCDRDELGATAADDLRRLARLLTVVERADVAMVLRQIRRVLGRLAAQ
jgi:hypothetical protein